MKEKTVLTVRQFVEACKRLSVECFTFNSADSREEGELGFTDHFLTFNEMIVCLLPSVIILKNSNGDEYRFNRVKRIMWEETEAGLFLDIVCGYPSTETRNKVFTISAV